MSESYVSIPVPLSLYAEVIRRHSERANAVVEHVLEDFLERTEEDHHRTRDSANGVLWESLFLPAGTKLRTKYFQEYVYANVVADHIEFEGEKFSSVSKVTNRMRGDTNNNAWNFVELSRPSDRGWVKARSLRI
jgi:hypothetical protein